jgi:hypothetical protein
LPPEGEMRTWLRAGSLLLVSQLYDLQPGSFVVRFTRSGYATADRAFTLPGNRFNALDVNVTK